MVGGDNSAAQLRDGSGRIATGGLSATQALGEPLLFLVGYGDWTGPASAALLGVGRTAGRTVATITARLGLASGLRGSPG